MILQNMDIWKMAVLKKTTSSNEFVTFPKKLISIDGQETDKLWVGNLNYYTLGFIYTGSFYTNSGGSGQTCLWIGTGTNDESYTDYSLIPVSTEDLSSYTGFTVQNIIDTDKNIIQFTRSFTFSSSLSAPITVTELGLVKQITVNYSGWKQFLITREKLLTPVVANAGETKTFSTIVEF